MCWQHNRQGEHGVATAEQGYRPAGRLDDGARSFVVSVEFENWDTFGRQAASVKERMAPDDRLRRRVGAPLAPRGARTGVHSLPFLFGQSEDGRALTRRELRLAEAGLFAATRFVRQLAAWPHPPLPYFSPVTFEPADAVLSFERRGGKGGKGGKGGQGGQGGQGGGGAAVRARCTFPSGNLLSRAYRWCSCPGAVRRFAPKPARVVTVAQAIEHHRGEVARLDAESAAVRGGGGGSWQGGSWQDKTARGDYEPYGQRYGLANALWESEEEPLVREAIAIAQDLLQADAADRYGVRNFLLDLLLEVGAWEACVALIESYAGETTEEWLWTKVLIMVKARGQDSKSAATALARAMQLNKHVYPLLVGDRLTEKGDYAAASQMGPGYGTDEHGVVYGAASNAVVYAHNYGKYWARDLSLGAWLRRAVEGGGARMEKEGVARADVAAGDGVAPTAPGVGGGAGAAGGAGSGAKQKVGKGLGALVCCASCGKYAGAAGGGGSGGSGPEVVAAKKVELKMCSVCRAIGYCSRECQKADWKAHKKVCGKPPAASGGAAAGGAAVAAPRPVAVGATVTISGIQSQLSLNGSRGTVTDGPDPGSGRWNVRCALDGQTRKLKAANLAVFLAGLDGGGGGAGSSVEAGCAYVVHPSWQRLNGRARKELATYHSEDGAALTGAAWAPWPLTKAEVPAMLCYPLYSFLAMHPAQRYKATVLALPTFRMSYSGPSDFTGAEVFPPHQHCLVLREDLAHADARRVPGHDMGKWMEHCLVGECRFTVSCQMSFASFYSSADNKGRFFDWPGGEAVGICPGTGADVFPSAKERVLLVATQMCGFRLDGGAATCLTRIIPRILTLAGYERLMGEKEEEGGRGAAAGSSGNRNANRRRLAHLPPDAPGIAPGTGTPQQAFPDLLRRMARQPPQKPPRHLPAAGDMWAQFHANGRYKAYERHRETLQFGVRPDGTSAPISPIAPGANLLPR